MLFNFFLYAVGYGLIFLLQALIQKAFSKSDTQEEGHLQVDVRSVVLFCVFVGLLFSVATQWLDSLVSYRHVVIAVLLSLLVSYWFFLAPVFYLWRKKDFVRDPELEKAIRKEGFHYKVLFTDAFKSNAYCTGGLPNARLIIVANNLKKHLTPKELRAVVYHEIGHHKRYHIFKLFAINVVITLLIISMFRYLLNMGLSVGWEVFWVFVIGATQGLMVYYIPAKFMKHMEYQADLFARRYFGEETVRSALIKMDEVTGGELTKGNINHPNLQKRLRNLQRVES